MRLILVLLVIVPTFSVAQVNRSASELAQENIQSYLTTKLFRLGPYKPVSYGELKAHKESNREIIWMIIHDFEITETQLVDDKRTQVTKNYSFAFFLDKKMQVRRAETFYYVNK